MISEDTLKESRYKFFYGWPVKVQTDQLCKTNWDGMKFCRFRGKEETADHLIFIYPSAVVWCWMRDSLGWNFRPVSMSNFQEVCMWVQMEKKGKLDGS